MLELLMQKIYPCIDIFSAHCHILYIGAFNETSYLWIDMFEVKIYVHWHV